MDNGVLYMTDTKQKNAARAFAEYWKDKGYEKGESQAFWLSLLLRRASANFDWSEISPTIFGAVFESTLNPETRRSGGMHYTSIENIHKVIDPLFLDALKKELEEIQAIEVWKMKEKGLTTFQKKLASLEFLEIPLPKLIQNQAA